MEEKKNLTTIVLDSLGIIAHIHIYIHRSFTRYTCKWTLSAKGPLFYLQVAENNDRASLSTSGVRQTKKKVKISQMQTHWLVHWGLVTPTKDCNFLSKSSSKDKNELFNSILHVNKTFIKYKKLLFQLGSVVQV